jgi:ankyrin repeat protein
LITHFGDHKLLPPQSHHERAREAHFRIERALRKSRLDNKWDLTASHILNLLSAYSAPQHSLTTIKRDNSVLLTILDDSPTSHMKVDEPDVACMARRFITRLASFLDPAEGNHLKRPNHSKALFLQWLRDIDLNTLNSLPSPAPVKEWELEDTPIIDALIGNANKYLDPKDSEKATILLEKFINFEKKGDLADPHCLTWEELKPLRRLMDSQDEAERVAIMKEATKCGYVSVLEALLDFSPSLQHPESNSLVIASARDGPTIYHFLTQLFWYFPPEYRQFQTTQQPMLLFKAVEIGDRHLTRELAKHSMPESADQYRQTCLILAAWNNHQIIVEDLLEGGAKVDGCVFGRYNKALLLTRFNHRDEWLRHEWITDSFTSYVNSSPKSTEVVKGPRPGSGAKGDYRGVVEEFLGTGNIPMAIAAISVRTALQAAAERGHLSMVRYLVEKKEANVNTGHYGQSWRSALQAAAGGGHLQVVEMLIKAGAQVNKPAWGYSGRTALQAAAEYGDLKVVDLLLEHNAKIIPTPTFSPDGGLSALAAAAKGGHLAVVDRLLERILVNGSLNPEEWDLGSALIAAAQGGHLAVVNGLIERNAPVGGSASMSFGRTALQAAAAGGNLQVLDRLLALDSDINAAGSGYGGRTALQAAAGGGHLAATNWLLERNADVDAPASDSDGRTALQAAAEGGHLAVVERLLERSADVNAAPAKDNGRTALQAAAGGGYPEDVDRVLKVVDLLLDRNADVNAPASDSGGRTALQAAAASGHLAIVERLLERSADVNAAPAKIRGRTALQAAAEGGHLAVVELLLARGADVNATPAEHSGRTALQAAAGNCHLAIVNLLLERGADVNATPAKDNGRTALQAAAQGGHLGVVDLLLEHNADVNAPANKFMGRTALQEAAENGHLAIAKRLLIEHNADINAARAEIEGVSALNAAQKGRYEDIYNVFTSFGAL